MRKAIKILCFLFSLPQFLTISGDTAVGKTHQYALVTRIDVQSRFHGDVYSHIYTDPDKMATILNYLRLMDDKGPAHTHSHADTPDGYRITIKHSDGSSVQYQQEDYCCQRRGVGAWEHIDKDHARMLYYLLLLIPDDSEKISDIENTCPTFLIIHKLRHSAKSSQ